VLKPRALPANRRQTLRQRWLRLLLVLVVTFPLAWYGPADMQFLQGAVAVTGTVVGLEPTQAGSPPEEVRVSFDLGSERFRYPARLGWFDHYKVGDPAPVLFNPELRPYLKLDTVWHRYRFLGIWIAMVGGIVLVTTARTLLQQRQRRLAKKASEDTPE